MFELSPLDPFVVVDFMLARIPVLPSSSAARSSARQEKSSIALQQRACTAQARAQQVVHLHKFTLGAGQTQGFRPLLDVFFPSIYRIFRVSHNANRWCIINQMFANSLPVDARVKNYR